MLWASMFSDKPMRALLLASLASATAFAQSPADQFETKVRPVLANNCYACHTSSALGGLRVDSREALLKGGKRGPAIVPGEPEKSLLVTAIQHSDPNLKMPMGMKLKDAEITAISNWIKEGAPWPKATVSQTKPASDEYVILPEQRKFWSFQPLQSPPVPTVKDTKWARTDIDRFILSKLEKEGLKPVKPATKRDLIRRASLDLTGLPPTYEAIQAFEKDTSPDAFAKVVDRLLASPHYGERWGRLWLDVARYGEDDYRSLDPMRRGYNPYPNAYLYRDWVIQAMNDDMPYDTFVKAQIAGDLMDEKVRHKMIPATGFLGLGPWYYDNGSVEVTRADERHDRVDVISRGFLGLTVACARCHDHKYDPIPMKDYYSMAGVFANVQYEEYPLVPQSVVKKFQQAEDLIYSKQNILFEMQQNQGMALARALALETSNYLLAVYEVTGKEKKDKAQVVEARKLDYELLDRWIRYMERPTKRYTHKDAWQAFMKKGGSPAEAKKLAEKFQEDLLAVMVARNDLDEENKVIAAKAMEGTKRKKRTNKPSNFVTNDDFCPGCDLQLKSLPEPDTYFWTEVFQRELADTDDPNAMGEAGFRNMKPGVLVFRGWGLEKRIGSEAQSQIAALRKDIEDARKQLEPYYPFVHGVKDLDKTEDLKLALRGDPMNLGDAVPRRFLAVLSDSERPLFRQGSGRMQLAESILAQPITTRVIVNRIWKGHFGTGIVDSPSNFGQTGERPTNPELLEYLASNFQKNGMSMKKLHRDIMLSSVYQLSTDNDPAAFEKDSGNRWYWRANKKRLEAEQLRDSVMLVSGNLDKSVGGPSADLAPTFLRRTVYGKVSRYKLDEYLQLFDFPSPNISAEKRFTTTVPLQRLFLMNSDFMQVEAEEFVKQIMAQPDNRARISKAYQLAYGRVPNEEEIKLGLEYLAAEPERAYLERKKKAEEEAAKAREKRGTPASKPAATTSSADDKGPAKVDGKDAAGDAPQENAEAPKPAAKPKADAAAKPADAKATEAKAEDMKPADKPEDMPEMGMGMGMMGGVMGGPGGRRPGAPEVKYEPTVWGRYVKVLLSSSEFLFVN